MTQTENSCETTSNDLLLWSSTDYFEYHSDLRGSTRSYNHNLLRYQTSHFFTTFNSHLNHNWFALHCCCQDASKISSTSNFHLQYHCLEYLHWGFIGAKFLSNRRNWPKYSNLQPCFHYLHSWVVCLEVEIDSILADFNSFWKAWWHLGCAERCTELQSRLSVLRPNCLSKSLTPKRAKPWKPEQF